MLKKIYIGILRILLKPIVDDHERLAKTHYLDMDRISKDLNRMYIDIQTQIHEIKEKQCTH